MLSVEECRTLLGRDDMTDAEVEEFLRDLRSLLGQFLDDFFREEFDPDGV
jgi:hypothetical protein